jgi:hypothetical protein
MARLIKNTFASLLSIILAWFVREQEIKELSPGKALACDDCQFILTGKRCNGCRFVAGINRHRSVSDSITSICNQARETASLPKVENIGLDAALVQELIAQRAVIESDDTLAGDFVSSDTCSATV